MSTYQIAINLEITSKCNARCVMCPQDQIHNPSLMDMQTFDTAISRINPQDVFRTVLAGYGEPTTHPKFDKMIARMGQHPGRFDLVTNGQQLDEDRLRPIDDNIHLMVISFSSIVRDVYERVHVKLDYDKVINNIVLAQKTLKNTTLGISLTPLPECLDTLPQTIEWLHANGIRSLTMSPTLYNWGGNMKDHQLESDRLRDIIKKYDLHSQELDFIPSINDIASQFRHNRFKCIPRNTDLFITSSGNYLYCYNDISHHNTFGHINDMSIREALSDRQRTQAIDSLCSNCNMRDRYGIGEVSKVAGRYLWSQTIQKARSFSATLS